MTRKIRNKFQADSDRIRNLLCLNTFSLRCRLENNQTVTRETDIVLLKPLPTTATLCIDLGTSNTSAGAYLFRDYVDSPIDLAANPAIEIDAINTVKFLSDEKWFETVPTAIYVREINGKSLNLLYGYETQEKLRELNYAPQSSVFKSIKRWLTDPNEELIMEDEKRNTLPGIRRGELLRGYIDYIIHQAESQFKCRFQSLHFSCPVKLKENYLKSFKSLYSREGERRFNIQLGNDALDEGVAVLYELIREKMKSIEPGRKESEKALIIDCGGGTTDLASCVFECEDTGSHYKLAIKVDREDGDADFGGDKITERIMQFMQVRYASQRADEITNTIDSFLPNFEDIFREIDSWLSQNDQSPIDYIYARLLAECQKAEAIFPLQYEKYRHSRNDYDRVRNNYFTLWEQAEEMKKAFFRSSEGIEVDFNSDKQGSGKKITLLFKNFRFHFRDKNKPGNWEILEMKNSPTFTIREIDTLIAADIYRVLCNLLAPNPEIEKGLIHYHHIKLSGQSSRIGLFRQSLKEFLPGRRIYTLKRSSEQQTTQQLKLNCLRGAIQYLHDKREGKIDLSLEYFKPNVPCEIYVTNYRDERLVLGMKDKPLQEAIGMHDMLNKGSDLRIHFSDNGREFRDERYIAQQWKKTALRDILKIDPRIEQKTHIDTLESNKIRFILYSSAAIYGIEVFAIKREQDEYFISASEPFKFDNMG